MERFATFSGEATTWQGLVRTIVSAEAPGGRHASRSLFAVFELATLTRPRLLTAEFGISLASSFSRFTAALTLLI